MIPSALTQLALSNYCALYLLLKAPDTLLQHLLCIQPAAIQDVTTRQATSAKLPGRSGANQVVGGSIYQMRRNTCPSRHGSLLCHHCGSITYKLRPHMRHPHLGAKQLHANCVKYRLWQIGRICSTAAGAVFAACCSKYLAKCLGLPDTTVLCPDGVGETNERTQMRDIHIVALSNVGAQLGVQ